MTPKKPATDTGDFVDGQEDTMATAQVGEHLKGPATPEQLALDLGLEPNSKVKLEPHTIYFHPAEWRALGKVVGGMSITNSDFVRAAVRKALQIERPD